MREDIVSDELTEEQHQIHKFYLFTFTIWIRYKEKNQQLSPLDIVGKKHQIGKLNMRHPGGSVG